ncbi:MAG: serine/threonine protein kinase [Anaerolineales bacterium]|nr:serine/threonine protein kinase [Anaerolineales bacterium]
MSRIILYHRQFALGPKIASGGFATIYRGKQLSNDEDVAIKICARHDDPAYTRSITKEAELIQRLRHRNIVKLFPIPRKGRASVYHARAVELPDHPTFFVMEYLHGGTLDQYLNAVGLLSLPEAATIALEVARALDHIHQKRYAHNDLKLENIVFRNPIRAGKPFSPVLVDFGIATKVRLPMAGTMYIKSPEQITSEVRDNNEAIDSPKVDVWGLGIVLYRMLGGQLPFESRNEKTLTERIRQSRPTSLLKLSRGVSQEADELIIDGCLAKKPNNRITLYQLGQSLRRLAGKRVVAVKSAEQADTTKAKWFKR